MNILQFILSSIRFLIRKLPVNFITTNKYVQYNNQNANNLIYKMIKKAFNEHKGLMIAKFGTYELDTMLYFYLKNYNLSALKEEIFGTRHIFWNEIKKHLPNTGFFPLEKSEAKKLADLYYSTLDNIDVLASYQTTEKNIIPKMKNCVFVNLNGYYAPFLWNSPWTGILENKKILVIHPFAISIQKQYEQRDKLFNDKSVLPKFKSLTVIKAVQTIASNKSDEFNTWFEALEYMEKQILLSDYDIALIGCGAYGLPLANFVKKQGKIAIHLAGWTQMLFGIYGERWLTDQPEFTKFINEYWIRPNNSEKPNSYNKIENGCYW